jgi:hypothetical protein
MDAASFVKLSEDTSNLKDIEEALDAGQDVNATGVVSTDLQKQGDEQVCRVLLVWMRV